MGDTREKILDATERLIVLKGLARVTTKDIARETGVSEGALYRHFRQKQEIFFALLLKHLPTVYKTFRECQESTGTIQEKLSAIVLAVVRYYELILPMAASLLADTELLQQFRETVRPFQVGPHTLMDHCAAYLEQEQEAGHLGKHLSAQKMAMFLLGPCFQQAFNVQMLGYDPFYQSTEQFASELIESILPMLLPS